MLLNLDFGRRARNRLMDRLRHVLDVVLGQAAHADSAGLQQVDAELLDEDVHLFLIESSIRKHSDLLGDVLPGSGRLQGH